MQLLIVYALHILIILLNHLICFIALICAMVRMISAMY
jgi:hypothetical protein